MFMRVRILLFHGSLQEAEQGTLPDSLFEVSIPDASQTKAVQEKENRGSTSHELTLCQLHTG